jgi:hypothetical protein
MGKGLFVASVIEACSLPTLRSIRLKCRIEPLPFAQRVIRLDPRWIPEGYPCSSLPPRLTSSPTDDIPQAPDHDGRKDLSRQGLPENLRQLVLVIHG